MESALSKIDTTVLDNIIVGRVEPYIYAFSTETVPNYLKVGDTSRGVRVRLDEWRKIFPNLIQQYQHTRTYLCGNECLYSCIQDASIRCIPLTVSHKHSLTSAQRISLHEIINSKLSTISKLLLRPGARTCCVLKRYVRHNHER